MSARRKTSSRLQNYYASQRALAQQYKMLSPTVQVTDKVRTFVAYACLAAEIIKRGEQANDVAFLESEWCATLREMVKIATDIEKRRNADYVKGD